MRRSLALCFLITLGGCTTEPAVPLCDADAARDCRVNQQACQLLDEVATCVACPAGDRADATGACAPIPGTAMTHEFPEITSAAGEEITRLCRSWTLDNDAELWVAAVEIDQDEASHHSNWTFVPESYFDGPDGVWPCADRDYHQLDAALAGGVIYAQSTQASHEVQLFAEGAAVRIPPRARIISDIHVLNATTETVTGHATMTLYTLPRDQVTTPLAPFHIEYHALDIPARARSRFVADVNLLEQFESATAEPFQIRLAYSLPHTHALGARVFLQAVGGPRDGEMLLDVNGYNGEARGLSYTPPLDLTGITGFRFGCEFENPRAERVGYGVGDQEMCEMLGFIDSVAAFESVVRETTSTTMDGDIQVFEGTTENFIIPWADRFTM